jgi:hypothetical protein
MIALVDEAEEDIGELTGMIRKAQSSAKVDNEDLVVYYCD